MEYTKQSFDDNWPLFEKMLGYLRYLKIAKYIKKKDNLICADIGCGFNARFLYSIRYKISKGYGFDLRANPGRRDNITVVNNSEYNGDIPLENETVDRVFLLAVLEHLDMESRIISESFRILKRGGLIVLTTPTPASKPLLEFLSYKIHLISEESIREHKHYYKKNELVALMDKNGCDVNHFSYFQFGFNQIIVGEKRKNKV